MSKPTYTLMRVDRRSNGTIFEAFATTLQGFDDFCAATESGILAGSTCDIADLKTVLRLRHDGTWEALELYGDSANPEQDAVEAILDDMVSDEEVGA